MKSCPVCDRSIPAHQATCQRSHCQEGDFHLNRARNLRKGSKAQRLALNKASDIREMVQASDERMRQLSTPEGWA